MITEKSIPRATAKRLSLYYRISKRFNTDNVEKTSSKQTVDAMGIDSAAVRRDFSYLGKLGRRGSGYNTKKLTNFFANILNDHSMTDVPLAGYGNIERALLHYRFHDHNKMQIAMIFDTDDNEMVGHETSDDIPIYGISSLKRHAQEVGIETVISTVPSSKAQEVADILVDADIHDILSFFPVHLNVPEDITVQHVDSISKLQALLYFMNQSNQDN